jgi:hypothetical protein
MTALDQVQSAGQKQLVIVGATRMVGGYALRYSLENPRVGRVTAIGRRAFGISNPKLKEVLHRDFADCSALAEALTRQDAAVFCLGTYTGSVSDPELHAITVNYTVEFVQTRGRITSRERAMVISRKRRNTATAAAARRLAAPLGIPYSSRMSPLRARVEKGRLVLDEPTTLPEGTVVDLVADDEGDDLTNEERRALHEALSASWKSAEAGRLLPASRILDELRRRR